MKTVRIVLFVVTASVAAVGCSSADTSSVGSAETTRLQNSTPMTAVQSFVMEGSVKVAPAHVVNKGDVGCDSDPRRIAASARTPVSVSDDKGVKVGAASLSRGTWLSDHGCQFTFTVEVKSGSDFYDVQIGTEDPITISEDDARTRGFRVGYGYDW